MSVKLWNFPPPPSNNLVFPPFYFSPINHYNKKKKSLKVLKKGKKVFGEKKIKYYILSYLWQNV